MTLDSDKNFGLVIAFVLPGFVCLWGASCWSSTVAGWLTVVPTANATVGGFLYASLGSLAAGLTVSSVRWAVVDTIHHRTGVQPPEWDFGRLQDKLQAFDALVENHYRYYQFYANMLVAVAFASGCDVCSGSRDAIHSIWAIVGLVFIENVFFAGSRDALRKYYSRAVNGGPKSQRLVREDLRRIVRSGVLGRTRQWVTDIWFGRTNTIVIAGEEHRCSRTWIYGLRFAAAC